jgi:hypothetical protein
VPGQVPHALAASGGNLSGERSFAWAAQNPDGNTIVCELTRQRGVMTGRPRLALADRARAKRHHRPSVALECVLGAPGCNLRFRDPKFWQRPFRRKRFSGQQGKRAHPIDHARQGALATAQVVDQSVAQLSKESGSQRNSGKPRCKRGLPGPQHDQRLHVMLIAQNVGELEITCQRQASPRQIEHHCLANARHVIGQRRTQGRAEDVDCEVRVLGVQHFHHRVAAHEIADPHIRNDQHRRGLWIEVAVHLRN